MTVKVVDAAGVAVYEMADAAGADRDAVRALAHEAMRAAAGTVTPGVVMGDLLGECDMAFSGGTLRAEAIVMRRRGETLHVAADVLAGGLRVASFEAQTLVAA